MPTSRENINSNNLTVETDTGQYFEGSVFDDLGKQLLETDLQYNFEFEDLGMEEVLVKKERSFENEPVSRAESFEQARLEVNKVSSDLIETIVHSEDFNLADFVEKRRLTEADIKFLGSPAKIAELHKNTTNMIARNIDLNVSKESYNQNQQVEIKAQFEAYFKSLRENSAATEKSIFDCCIASSNGSNVFPMSQTEYQGFNINNLDIFDQSSESAGIYSNIKIRQRNKGNCIIRGMSGEMINQKIRNEDHNFERSIYLNPNIESAPAVFEDLLKAANDKKVAASIDMTNKVFGSSVASRLKKYENHNSKLRIDPIEVRLSNKDADVFLKEAIRVAKEHQEEFEGRGSPRIAYEVTDGVAISDLPKGEPLTTNRLKLMESVRAQVFESNKQGQEATDLFRDLLEKELKQDGINPDNMAFNADRPLISQEVKPQPEELPVTGEQEAVKVESPNKFKQNRRKLDKEVIASLQPRGFEKAEQQSFDRFEAARNKVDKQTVDLFIEKAIENSQSFRFGRAKSFLDSLELTEADKDFIAQPDRIVKLQDLYDHLVIKNFNVYFDQNVPPERRNEVMGSFNTYFRDRRQSAKSGKASVGNRISQYLQGDRNSDFPFDEIEYRGCSINGKDALSINTPTNKEFRANIKIQRYVEGSFIMAYSNEMVKQKMDNKEQDLDRLIYLNPNFESAPAVFEEVLRFANKNGISLQLKTFNRIGELSQLNLKLSKNQDKDVSARGDGIVVYVNKESANTVLDKVLNISQKNNLAFEGRKVARIAHQLGEGVGIGDRSVNWNEDSLTSNRSKLLNRALDTARKRLKDPDQDRFREALKAAIQFEAICEGANPDNLAFNQ